MLDSGYTCVDGRVLAKPGTPLAEGDLMFLRCVRGVQGPLPQGQNTRQGPPLAPTHQPRLHGPQEERLARAAARGCRQGHPPRGTERVELRGEGQWSGCHAGQREHAGG